MFSTDRHTAAHRQRGFTLLELMICIAVVAILAAVAIPGYRGQVSAARRADCMAALLGLAQAMERHYARNFSYAGAAAEGDDAGAPAPGLYPSRCPVEGDAQYDLTIESATASAFQLRATPRAGGSQAGDGFIRVDHLGRRQWDRDGDGSIGAGENRWSR